MDAESGDVKIGKILKDMLPGGGEDQFVKN